ncbi:MAG: VOC family protein [Phreatobacter sp.]|uniref:VOC family protein n=1 Tax=Phreatobacter sp. TaxID=1966341 RepID=UPI004035328F
MAAEPAAVALITLGVDDLQRATRFYEEIGFAKSVSQSSDTVSFFRAGGVVLALFGRRALAEDAGLPEEQRSGFGGITLARNFPSREAVDEAFVRAVSAGATPLKTPRDVFWGGYSGYVADPDGHPIELAWNPLFPVNADGTIDLPM